VYSVLQRSALWILEPVQSTRPCRRVTVPNIGPQRRVGYLDQTRILKTYACSLFDTLILDLLRL